jgi:hypothetical protein
VTVVAGALQRDGLIRYHGGRVSSRARRRLEGVARADYRVIADATDQLLGPTS